MTATLVLSGFRTVARLVEDRAYCRWLLHQPWFRPKWPEVYALVAAEWPVERLLEEPLRGGKSFRRGDSFKRPGYRISGKPAKRDPSELCLARTRNGGRCQRRKAPGKKRCVQHGGAPRSGRPVGYPEHPNTAAARKAWYARMWALKRAGKISRFPQGTKRKVTLTLPRVEKSRMIQPLWRLSRSRSSPQLKNYSYNNGLCIVWRRSETVKSFDDALENREGAGGLTGI
jgi:hypothetical protein